MSRDIRAASVREDARSVVHHRGVTVEFQQTSHVTDSEAYRLAEKVRALMMAEGLWVRGDFTIRTEKPR